MTQISEQEREVLIKRMQTHLMKAAVELMGANELAQVLGLEEHERHSGAAVLAITLILEEDGISA